MLFFYPPSTTLIVLSLTFYVCPPPPPPRSIYLSAWHLAAAHVQKAMPSHVNSVLCSLCDTFVTSVILSHITHEVFVFCCPVVV